VAGNAEARRRPGRWPLLVAAVIGVAAALALLGVWFSNRSGTDREAGARTVAVAYTRARLTHDYSVWWDSVAPACRSGSSKSQWVEKVRAGYESLGTPGAPADIKVQVVGLTRVGDLLRLKVHVTSPAPARSGDLEVDVQEVSGSWRVVGYGTPGDADRCAVL
jgi:hypothetical protein